MGVSSAQVEWLVKSLVHALGEHGVRVDRVILFGSAARGSTTPQSDVDLVVVSEDFGRSVLEDYTLVYRCLPPRDFPVDAVPKHPRQLSAAHPESLVGTALATGRVMYVRK